MLLDQKNVFSDGQAITGDAVSTNVIDLSQAMRAPGNELDVIVQVTEAFNNLTSLELQVQSSVDEAFTSPVTHQRVSVTLASGRLALGQRLDLGSLLDGTLRYVRLNYDVTGTNPSTGRLTAMLLPFGDQTLVGQA